MAPREKSKQGSTAAQVLLAADARKKSLPVWLARNAQWAREAPLTAMQRAWLEAQGFKGAARKHALLPGADGELAGAVLGVGEGRAGDPMERPEVAVGLLPSLLPAGCYHLADDPGDPQLAAVAWGLGAYRFRRYKTSGDSEVPQLKLPRGADHAQAIALTDAVWLGRDLINTPASDMGTQELEDAARQLGKSHGAKVSSIVGDELLAKNFPLIHAVGRASPRPPRLIDLQWGRDSAPQIVVIGKGIAFDTGGLDIKPASAMLIMKKDMGGAASALALGHMVMAARLDVRLRIL
ncbi:MAG TPA: leucyl aminopeptidase family protein, partial [Hyphomicrobiaceae bacterium]|nr:leucyl aminopeptidase family protein [Hyphomicrobiaceae bacterium]